MGLRKNDIIEIEITGMTAEGKGVGRYEGQAVFVPAAAQGDLLEVKIIKLAKTYAVGKIQHILSPAKERCEADCPVFLQCGGCCYRHITYEEELRIKSRRVVDAIERIGGIKGFLAEPIWGAAEPNRYRNKAQLPVGMAADGQLHAGFFAPHSHRIVPCRDCLLQPAEFAMITDMILRQAGKWGISVYQEELHKGKLRHLCYRKTADGDIMVCIVINANGLSCEKELARTITEAFPQIKSMVINVNKERTNVILGKRCRTIWGQDTITDTLCGLEFQISPLSFYQVNHDQAQRLYETAGEYAGLTGSERLLDLYCGTGTIGLSMAKRAKEIIGVEIVAQAVEDAENNARRNGVANARFLCADAAQAARELSSQGLRPDVVVLDPPRKGSDIQTLQIIASEMQPKRIVYVSCDPATLARDIRVLSDLGYLLQRVRPVDMFPRTHHVETVALLQREGL